MKYFNKFSGRSIAVVGGNSKTANLIEAEKRDIVIRANYHYLVQGGRCDVLFIGTYDEFIPPEPHPKLIFCMSRDYFELVKSKCPNSLVFFVDKERYVEPMQNYKHEWVNTFQHELNTNAFTGILATKWATIQDATEIYITGMDFYQREDGKFPIFEQPHHIPPQWNWLRWTWHTDMRVNVDETLHRVLRLDEIDRGIRG